jgi:hypothetical protein
MSDKLKKYVKVILPEPERKDFYKLLNQAVHKGEEIRPQEKASQRTSYKGSSKTKMK